MAINNISPAQLRALHALYGVNSQHLLSAQGADPHAERLAWASQHAGRPIASFKELRVHEAAALIDLLKKAVGQEPTPASRRPRTREAAMAAGTHGRKNRIVKIAVMATTADLNEIDALREHVGMTREGFETWLMSRSSPIGQRGGKLRTIADCNRVRWALKAMLRRAG